MFGVCCITEDKEVLNCVVAEEKVVFGAHAHAVSQMTVAKIRKVYNKVDSKSIAKQVGSLKVKDTEKLCSVHDKYYQSLITRFSSVLLRKTTCENGLVFFESNNMKCFLFLSP